MQIRLLMPASSHYSPSIDVYLLAYCGKPFLRTRPAAAASRSCACDQIEKARRGGGAGSSFARALHGASVLQASAASRTTVQQLLRRDGIRSIAGQQHLLFRLASLVFIMPPDLPNPISIYLSGCAEFWLSYLIFMHNNFAELENGGAKALKSFLFSCAVSILHPKSRNQPCPLGSRC